MTQLEDYADAFRRSREQAHRVAWELSDDAFNWKPSAKSWSVGECLTHLNIIADGYLPALRAAFDDAGAPRGEGPFRYGWFSRRFIAAVTPGSRAIPTANNMKPPAAEATRSHLDADRTRADFDAHTDGWIDIIERADGLDLARIKVRSPFMSFLHLPAGAIVEALGQHALRHVGQAERVTQRPGFPD